MNLTYPEKRLIAAIMKIPGIVTAEGKQINSRKLRKVDPNYHRAKGKLCDKGILFVYEDYSPGVYSQRYLLDIDAIPVREIMDISKAITSFNRESDPRCEAQVKSLESFAIDIDAAIKSIYKENSIEKVAARIGPVEVIEDKLYCNGEVVRTNSLRAIELSKETGLENGHRFFIGKDKIKEHLEYTDVFTFKSNKGKAKVLIGNKRLFLERKRNQLILSAIHIVTEIHNRIWWAKKSDTNGREFNTLTNLPNYLWKHMTEGGDTVGGVDLSNADLLAWLKAYSDDFKRFPPNPNTPSTPFPPNIPLSSIPIPTSSSLPSLPFHTHSVRQGFPEDVQRFKEGVTSGEIYRNGMRFLGMEETKENRGMMKATFFAMGYDVPRDNVMNKMFEKLHPTFKGWMDERKTQMGNRNFAVWMQSIVSNAFDEVFRELHKVMNGVGKHDEWRCSIHRVEEAEAIMRRILLKYFEYGFKLKSK